MKKKTNFIWYFIAFGFIALFILMLLSSILDVGERLRNVHRYVEYGFYALTVLLIYFLIVRPISIILFSPSLSIATSMDKDSYKRHRVYKKVAKRLLNHPDIPDVAKEQLKASMHDKDQLREALNHTYQHHIKKAMNKLIQQHAKTVMISTAISQNGRLDFFTVIAVNLKMIKQIVVLCGFRPSYRHLAKLTINVMSTALIAEGLENINISDILPQSTLNVISEIPLIKPIMSSVMQGVSNALLTLRIGIVTRKYLFSDENDVTQEKIRFGALIEASKHLPIVIADALFLFPKTIFNMFKGKKKDKLELDEPSQI